MYNELCHCQLHSRDRPRNKRLTVPKTTRPVKVVPHNPTLRDTSMNLSLRVAIVAVTVSMLSSSLRAQEPGEGAAPKKNGKTSGPPRSRNMPPSALPPELIARLGNLIEKDWKDRPEWAQMAVAVLKGKQMGMGSRSGWFGPGRSRYNWTWLQKRFDKKPKDGKIEPSELATGILQTDFKRLDRDHNGAITKDDLDWSAGNLLLGDSPANQVFYRLDRDSNGRVTLEEINQFFKQAAGEFEFLTPEDLRNALGFRESPGQQQRGRGGPPPGIRWKMFQRLLNGELGTLESGPDLDQMAPDFKLPLLAHDAKKTKLVLTDKFVRLSDSRGKRPVVLIFGSFT